MGIFRHGYDCLSSNTLSLLSHHQLPNYDSHNILFTFRHFHKTSTFAVELMQCFSAPKHNSCRGTTLACFTRHPPQSAAHTAPSIVYDGPDGPRESMSWRRCSYFACAVSWS